MRSRIRHLILATILFPLPIIVIVPIILKFQFDLHVIQSEYWGFWLSKLLIPAGFSTAGYCATLFFIEGRGTPAPWYPPTKLMTEGPYRYVRNPMISGIFLVLTAETLLFSAPSIAVWMAFLFVVYTIYFIFVEEPGLEKRFGDDYVLYKANVGRWIPRYPGWKAPWNETDDTEDQNESKTDVQDSGSTSTDKESDAQKGNPAS